MLTVRYPNGQAIQYNNANYLRYSTSAYEIYNGDPDKSGKWIASIQLSAGAIVETTCPCKIHNALNENQFNNLTNELLRINKELKLIKKEIKKKEG